MRIVFIDIQNNGFFFRTLREYLLRVRAPKKYVPVLRELLQHKNDIQVCNYISSKGSSLFALRGKASSAPKWLSWLELKIAARLNKFNLNSVKLIFSPQDIHPDDVVIYFIHSFVSPAEVKELGGKKLMHLNQFYFWPSEIIRNNKAGVEGYISEADQTKNKGIFSDIYSGGQKLPTIIMPYCIGNRFKFLKPFRERKNKALSIGTLGITGNQEFVKYYHTDHLQPIRWLVYENQEKIKDYIDSCHFLYNENTNRSKKIDKFSKRNPFVLIYKLCLMLTCPPQKNYTSFNILNKYNDYRMSVIGEEQAGFPAIAAFESMACGCALLAIDHSMYRDLGLIPGKHYIAYDGTLDGLTATIARYQQLPEELEDIAKAGHQFVHENFTSKKIVNNLISNLQKL